MKKRIILPLLVVLALTLTACATDTEEPEPDTTAPVEDETQDEVQDEDTEDKDTEDKDIDEKPEVDVDVDVPGVENYEDVKLKPVEVFDKYMEEYPDTQILEIGLDKDLGSYLYKVEGFDSDKKYQLNMNPENGEITKEKDKEEILDKDHDEEDAITIEHVRKVDSLIEEALEDAGEDHVIKSWNLEMDDNKAILEIKLDKEGFGDIEYEYDVESEELLEKDS